MTQLVGGEKSTSMPKSSIEVVQHVRHSEGTNVLKPICHEVR